MNVYCVWLHIRWNASKVEDSTLNIRRLVRKKITETHWFTSCECDVCLINEEYSILTVLGFWKFSLWLFDWFIAWNKSESRVFGRGHSNTIIIYSFPWRYTLLRINVLNFSYPSTGVRNKSTVALNWFAFRISPTILPPISIRFDIATMSIKCFQIPI